jgi:hypothetical protein
VKEKKPGLSPANKTCYVLFLTVRLGGLEVIPYERDNLQTSNLPRVPGAAE